MGHDESLSLWTKLKRDGFKCKVFTDKPTNLQRFKSIFGVKPQLESKSNPDFLVKTINGKDVAVYGIDIWYTQATVNGELIFDGRRFDDQDLFDAIEEATA